MILRRIGEWRNIMAQESKIQTSLVERINTSRRRALQYGTLVTVGASSLLRTGDVHASLFKAKEAAG